jgi:hypothetical protein
MKDPIVQEVREARAAVAADFDFDLHKFFAWAKTHTAIEKKAKHRLPTGPTKPTVKAIAKPSKSPAARKRSARPARALA